MKNFSLKFIDIMVGIVLGLGFQNWGVLKDLWQYIAFIFIYLDIVDYWIDYSPALKKFPPKREIDVFLDIAIMFSLFLLIYSTQLSVINFLASFIFLRILDFFWLWSSKQEYNPIGLDKLFVETWLILDFIEGIMTAFLLGTALILSLEPLIVIVSFIIFRIITRTIASFRYKRFHFA